MTSLKPHLRVLKAIVLLSACWRTPCWGALSAQLFFDNEEKTTMTAGAATNLQLEIFDPESAEPIHHFHPMHDKKMHLIVISDDLETFAHLHPVQPREHISIFEIDLNQPTSDPDNQDALKAVTKAGPYFLFSESMPMGYSMTTLPLDFTAVGTPQAKKPLVLDPIAPDSFIYKRVNGYEIKLKPQTYFHCGTFSALLETELKYFDSSSQSYQDVMDLQPWLNSFGHAIMLSEEGKTALEKTFVHLHAVWPLVDDPETERGPSLRLASDNHTPLKEGIYKIWLQFKHHDEIQTIPFVVEIKAPISSSRPPNSIGLGSGLDSFCL